MVFDSIKDCGTCFAAGLSIWIFALVAVEGQNTERSIIDPFCHCQSSRKRHLIAEILGKLQHTHPGDTSRSARVCSWGLQLDLELVAML